MWRCVSSILPRNITDTAGACWLCSRIVRYRRQHSYAAQLPLHIFCRSLPTYDTVTQRFDAIAVFAMQHLDSGGVERGTTRDCAMHGLDIPTTFDWRRFDNCDERTCWESDSTTSCDVPVKAGEVSRINWMGRSKISGTDSPSGVFPRFVLVAACLCQDIQVSLVPKITALVQRFTNGDQKGSDSRAAPYTDGSFDDFDGGSAKGPMAHKDSGRLTERELRAHILAAADRLVSHFAEMHGSYLGCQIKQALLAGEMINMNDMRCRVRPTFLSAGNAIKYVALEAAAVLQVDPAGDAICKFEGGAPSSQSLQVCL